MNNTIKATAIIAISGLVGGAVTYIFLKRKFNARLSKEIESIKKIGTFKKVDGIKKAEDKDDSALSSSASKKVSDKETDDSKSGYFDYSKVYKSSLDTPSISQKEKDESTDIIRVISSDEFDTLEDYESVWLSYYADGVLADDQDEVTDIPSTVGSKCLTALESHSTDVVHVRNSKLKCDYEIVYDKRTYREVVGQYPSSSKKGD
ncbi:MAG: hypothetical protein LUD27_02760 [Clostridia bacterium]|nr:hypothetical protein [Clostridia bacterium]